ncbi:hypothetical protein ETU09_05800 [Apibacter muscae]|uniref:Uncharacterized protein n=1 Tax=Apibacter muscae TaxID=2509004 RepID=A0A563DED7_9FLAO|nr:hypothetical protein [Apibacter muscae]TWP28437.1 hypothetical protein ETU09_05800 [Apibacter muscae]
MSSIKELAKKIPDNIRSGYLITEEDPILNASPKLSNPNMKLLAEIWKKFIYPNEEITDCPICMDRILTNFRQMKDDLIELERDYRKLNSF